MTAEPCPRCGRAKVSPGDLFPHAIDALEGLERMRLVVPDTTKAALRLLVAALACHAGRCER